MDNLSLVLAFPNSRLQIYLSCSHYVALLLVQTSCLIACQWSLHASRCLPLCLQTTMNLPQKNDDFVSFPQSFQTMDFSKRIVDYK